MNEICRLCCTSTNVNNDIYCDKTSLFLKMTFIPIQFFKNDRLPQKVCNKCKCKVLDFHSFCLSAIEAQNKLLSRLQPERCVATQPTAAVDWDTDIAIPAKDEESDEEPEVVLESLPQTGDIKFEVDPLGDQRPVPEEQSSFVCSVTISNIKDELSPETEEPEETDSIISEENQIMTSNYSKESLNPCMPKSSQELQLSSQTKKNKNQGFKDSVKSETCVSDTKHSRITAKIESSQGTCKLFGNQEAIKFSRSGESSVAATDNDSMMGLPLHVELAVSDEHSVGNFVSFLNTAREETSLAADKSKRGRKRIRQPELWQRNIRKMKREAGEEYVDSKGKLKPAKVVQPGCESTCKLTCSAHFDAALREKIKFDFYSLSDAEKYKYYAVYTRRTHKDRQRTKHENSRRMFSFLYYLPKEKDIVRVCKTFFCSTLAISARRVYYFHFKLEQNDLAVPSPEKGKFVKKETPAHKVAEVVEHIRSFPTRESRCCGAAGASGAAGALRYLQPGLSVAKMHALYLERAEDPVKLNIYRKIFCEKFNLGFFRFKKDLCESCSSFKSQTPLSSDMIQNYTQYLEEREREATMGGTQTPI